MTLVLIVVLVTLCLFAVFWGGSLVAQSYFYNEPADYLPHRAAGAALLVALFLMTWCALNRKSPNVYNTFFEFSPETTAEFTAFEAARWTAVIGPKAELEKDAGGKYAETVTPYQKQGSGAAGSRLKAYVRPGTAEAFAVNGGRDGRQFMTAALLIKADGPDAPPVRFDAEFEKTTRPGAAPNYTPEWKFSEKGGSRYLYATEKQFGTMFVPSTGALLLVLLINAVHYLVWLVAFWLVLRFSLGHALGLTVAFGVACMLVVMPLLFKFARRGEPAPAPQLVWAAPATAGQA